MVRDVLPDRRRRVRALAAVLLVCVALVGVGGAIAAFGGSGVYGDADTGTLIAIQSYGGFGNNGKAILVRNGEVVWEYDPPNSRVFDVEKLENGNIMVSVATKLPPEECPDRALEIDGNQCVKNRVVELSFPDKEVVWQYAWYDEFIRHHEVHDADRLPNGNTAIIDMGNNRAFVVNDSKGIVWSWSAEKHLGPGSDFWAAYGEHLSPPGIETDWTHMNDIDLLENGNFQLSIRNFDVVVEVNRDKEIVDVIGSPQGSGGDGPGTDPVLHHQHNPMRIEGAGTVLVADSEANRVVEVDTETGDVVWEYTGLRWPRDADRLPNGHTLITDTLNSRVIELNRQGEIVWEYPIVENGRRGIPYEADRVSLPEEPSDVPSGRTLNVSESGATVFTDLRRYVGIVMVFLPPWIGTTEFAALVVATLATLGLALEGIGWGVGLVVERVRA